MQKKNKLIHDATPKNGLIKMGEPGGMYEFTPQGVVEARHKRSDGPKINAAKKKDDGKAWPKTMVNKSRTTQGPKR